MVASHDEFSWLPLDQLHVVETLAYVDSLIERAGNLHFDYLEGGPFVLRDVVRGPDTHVTLESVTPIPPALSRVVADIMNQLRSALEHVLFVEVGRAEGRQLTRREQLSIEMPASSTWEAFNGWPKQRNRTDISSLQPGSQLFRRIERLMPFQRRISERHPMRLLAEYTNTFKHRAPAVASMLIGRVNSDLGDDRLRTPQRDSRPAEAGDILATAPTGAVILMSVWPQVSLQCPSDQSWRVLMHELRDLETWVRTIAVPVLIVGESNVPVLRPRIDIARPQKDIRAAMIDAPPETAFSRDERRLKAKTARMSLEETLVLSTQAGSLSEIQHWVSRLSDDEALEWTGRLLDARDDSEAAASWAAEAESAVADAARSNDS